MENPSFPLGTRVRQKNLAEIVKDQAMMDKLMQSKAQRSIRDELYENGTIMVDVLYQFIFYETI